MSNTPKLKLAAKWVKSSRGAAYQVGNQVFCSVYKTNRRGLPYTSDNWLTMRGAVQHKTLDLAVMHVQAEVDAWFADLSPDIEIVRDENDPEVAP